MERGASASSATLKDVAELAEVDVSTASRVLRGDPRGTVRLETRERILGAARSLHYRPNALARGLRTRRTDTIGLIVPSIDNIGFADVIHGIQAAAAEAGRLVLMVEAEAVARNGARADDAYQRLAGDRRLDGLLVAFATVSDGLVAQLAASDTPLVLVNRRTEGVHGSVVVDDESGTRLGVEQLISLGHRRIGFIGFGAEADTARRREAGYRGAMRDAGLDVEPGFLAHGRPTVDGGRAATETMLGSNADRRPTALLVASLLGAVGAMTALRAHAVSIPDQLSLVAFNDHELAGHLHPPLTTIRMPNLRMGQAAVAMLLEAIDGRPVEDLMITDSPEIVVRSSTGSPGS
jgi:LacI family transcriptional regulator